MNDIISAVGASLDGDALERISGMLGTDPSTTRNAIGSALPVIVGALANNASSPDGAASLHQALASDHDGSLLDNLGGFLNNPALVNGAGILKHMFGNKQPEVGGAAAQGTGLNSGQMMQLMSILAPIVMAYLGRQRNQHQLDPGSLGGMLNQQKAPSGLGGILGSLTGGLDANKDGSILDDVAGMAGKMFGNKN
jgi:hypothetical protein